HGWRPDEKPAHRERVSAYFLKPASWPSCWRRCRRLRKALPERRRALLLVALVVFLRIVVAENHTTILRLVFHRRRAIGWRGLLPGRHVIQPDTTHASRRPALLRYSSRLSPVAARLRARRMQRRDRRSDKECQSHRELLHLSSHGHRPPVPSLTRARPVPPTRPRASLVRSCKSYT